MKSNKSKGLIGLLILVIAICAFGFFSMNILQKSNEALSNVQNVASASDASNTIKLGLDLAGGVSITYQAKDENPSAEDMADTIYKLQQRVQNYSTEAEVYQEGDNRINVDIPGVSDANTILAELGQPGSLFFVDEAGNVLLTGDQVANAQAGTIGGNNAASSQYVVELTFTEAGSATFAEITAANVGKHIGIVYDGNLVSYPTVKQAITGGTAQIDGMTSFEEANNLASTIRIGSLSLELEELRSNVVGAKLGQQAISTSLKAGLVGLAIIIIFMIVIYLLPGVAASLALLLYVGIMIVLLALFRDVVTLTLPGVAGIVLSIGMAVDANVIIFTRIKEEIGLGKTVKSALKAGFSKAMSAIIDGNVTTIIACIILMIFGSGTVKGFATTLLMGVVLSLITALFVTKGAIYSFYYLGLSSPKLYGIKKEAKVWDFVGKRKIFFAISIAAILAGFVGMGLNMSQTGGLFNYGLDFKGGTSTNVTFNEDMSLDDISAKVVPVVEGITKEAGTQTQKVSDSTEVIIKTRSLTLDEREALNQALADNFGVDAEKITAESISAAVSSEMKRDAIVAVILATICMLIYIRIRFSDFKFAASAVLALCHDVLVVIAFYALAKWSVGSTFIACMLTIVGYSINATIVIFARIRENLRERKKNQSLADIVNLSVSQTFTRSINTSLTTFIMVFVLFIMGVSSIREFALPIMVGIVAGGYSSVCVTGSLWYIMSEKAAKKKAEKQK